MIPDEKNMNYLDETQILIHLREFSRELYYSPYYYKKICIGL